MKKTTIITTASLLLSLCGLQAQETTAYTKPSGFVTHTLKAGQFNLIGLTLHESVSVTGKLSGVAGTALTDENTDFDEALDSGKTYILEMTSGALQGTIQVLTSANWSGDTLTTPDDLTAGSDKVAVNDTYQVRAAKTLEDVFGTDSSVLQKGNFSSFADIVWLPNDQGGYDRYFLNTANQWKNAATNALAPNVPLVYVDALFIERKGAEVDLVLTGVVKSNSSAIVLSNGFNLVSVISPVGATLQNSGLAGTLKKGNFSSFADLVWLPNDQGGYDRYFVDTSGQWKNAANNAVVTEDVDLPTGYFIERKGEAVEAVITPPEEYTDL